MESKKTFIPVEQLRLFMSVLDTCMDDYLFILNLENRYYEISRSAVERFRIPSDEYYLTDEMLRQQVYGKDIPLIVQDIQELIENKKRHHNLEYRWLDKDGQPVWINCRGRVLVDENGNAQYLIGCVNEIGRKQKADNVSGLIVSTAMQDFLQKDCSQDRNGFLLRIDIDNFHEINEKLGMAYGDMILHDTAEQIESALCEGQMLYHIAADEFVVLDLVSKTPRDAHNLYRRIRSRIDQYVADNNYAVFFTISAGVVELNKVDSHDYVMLMKLAEFALREAKRRGKNTDYFFDNADYDAFLRKNILLQCLHQAVLHDFEGFETHFQPVEDIRENIMCGAETLLRFQCEETGSVSPAEFIPLLEESGLIIPVGRWVLSEAMDFCKKMQTMNPDFKVSVNISYIQVLKSDLIRDIKALLAQHELAPGSIQIELTESGFFESDTSYINFCADLKLLGIPLALDDFGTGYSNFHYLYHIDPQIIKIDRSFTLKALKYDYEYNLLHHMVDLAHSINSKLCIEGIETKEELDKICTLGPDYIQGYYFGKTYPGPMFLAKYINK